MSCSSHQASNRRSMAAKSGWVETGAKRLSVESLIISFSSLAAARHIEKRPIPGRDGAYCPRCHPHWLTIRAASPLDRTRVHARPGPTGGDPVAGYDVARQAEE